MPFGWNFFATEKQYRILARLRGTTGPVNCLSLTRDGKLLASGADDQALRIWNVRGKCHLQTLRDKSERWGQVTCLKWLSISSPEGCILCFGTGRGLILVYQGGRSLLANFRELSMTNAFTVNDPVESVDYDRAMSRLVVSSHCGKIKMYNVDKNGALTLAWEKSMAASVVGTHCAIPRSLRFIVKGEQLLVFGLESGIMESKISATGINDWSKTLNSSIGNAFLDPGEKILVVDNLVDGFDLYKYPHAVPFNTIEVPRKTRFVHGAAFVENGAQIACGSDHGIIYLHSVEQGELLQRLTHGSRRTMIQALDAISTNDCHLIASGSNDSHPYIIIWERVTKAHIQKNGSIESSSIVSILITINFLVVIVLSLVVGLNRSQKEAIVAETQKLLRFPSSEPSQSDVSQAVRMYTTENSWLSIERSKALLRKQGIDIDDPQWRAQLDNMD